MADAEADLASVPTGLRLDIAGLLLLAAMAWLLPQWGLDLAARPALLNFGPNDADYVRGFRVDWERDGRTRFHWTSPAANVTLPLRLRGDGHLLRMRMRRHFVEPAHVRLMAEGRTVHAFDIQADTKVPYHVLEIALPVLEGRHPFILSIEAGSENPRPLGIALDWMEVVRGRGGRFLLLDATRLWISLAVVAAFILPRLAGATRRVAIAHALALAAAASSGAAADVIAAERIARDGAPAYLALGLLALGVSRSPAVRRALGIERPSSAGALVVLVLAALTLRLVLLLHPQFYYPDVRVHALFALQLARRGLGPFLEEFTANQYRFSLGLQLENGHWYAFPYPPAFYLLSWPLISLAHYRPEAAVSILAAALNSLEAFVVFGIARRLRCVEAASLGAVVAHSVLPLFLARLSLAYFPALAGHAVDATVLLFLLSKLAQTDRPAVSLMFAGLLGLALLTYTQSLINFAILLALFLALDAGFARTSRDGRRQIGLALGGMAGAFLALALFYGRYVPIFIDMQRGIPMPEEKILVEKLAQQRAREGGEQTVAEEPDPYTGSSTDPVRGLRKASWRLFVFYGAFAPLVVAGVGVLLLRLEGSVARLVAAWALTYLLLNLASGGLPGPNLLRYNKDLEIIAPLCCVSLATLGFWIWERGQPWSRFVALAYGASFVAFGLARGYAYLTEKFVLER